MERVSLNVSNARGPAVGFDEVFSRGELDKLGDGAKAQDDKQAHWWKITAGTSDGNSREGWVCETGHQNVQWHSPWEWPGFELVDNTSVSLLDSFKRHLYVYELLFDGDKEAFEPSAVSVNGSALIKKLEKVVDRLGNNDGKVSAQELGRAQRVRWVAQAMSHLVVRYESEWGGDVSKWESLSSLMKERKYIWQAELERIEKLRWWDKVHGVAGLPADPAVYHFHPVGVISTFFHVKKAENDFNEEDARRALRYIFDKYGRQIAETVERMYRTETRHFQSMQYRRCGTGGMEVHGEPAYYGWTPEFFSEPPTGTWSAYEGAGLSGAGGNAQVTTRPKVFVVVSSVEIGMEFKAKYILKYDGNYARWYSTDSHAQELYRKTLNSITPRIVNSFN